MQSPRLEQHMNTLRRPSRRILAFVAALTACAVFASTASATISGYQEPSYTKTSANNTYWFNWQAFQGHDPNGNNDNRYYLCERTERNNVVIENPNGSQGPGAQNCTGLLRSNSGGANSGNFAWLPLNGNASVLDEGASYKVCSDGYYFDFFLWSRDSANLGNCSASIIDR